MNIEIWKDVVGFEGLYEVSNFGRVRSVEHTTFVQREKDLIPYNHLQKQKILSQRTGKTGYVKVNLYRNTVRSRSMKTALVHRLVAEAFIDNPNNYKHINHKDENKENNCAENLEWCTAKYNLNYGSRKYVLTKKVRQLSLDGTLINEFYGVREAERKTGISHSGISNCCNRKPGYETAGGFRWEYAS